MRSIVSAPPTITQGVQFYPIGQDQIAHLLDSKSVVYLNQSAQALIDLCDGKRGAGEICRTLADQVGLSPEDLHGDVASALGCLAVENLIRVERSILDELSSYGRADTSASYLRFGPQTLRVQTTCRAAEAELRERFQHLLGPADDGALLTLDVIPVSDSPDEYAYIHTGIDDVNFSQLFLKGNLDFLKQSIVNPFKWTTTDCAWFHAGAVAKDSKSVILTGLPGSGKSSIAAELCRRGWDYLSDEVLPISTTHLHTLPFPVTPLPRRHTSEILPSHRLSEIDRDFIELHDDRICKRPTTPVAIFFPRYAPGVKPSVEPLELGVAAAALLNNCITVCSRGEQAIHLVAKLLDEAPSYALFYDRAEHACDQIAQVLDEGAGRGGSL